MAALQVIVFAAGGRELARLSELQPVTELPPFKGLMRGYEIGKSSLLTFPAVDAIVIATLKR